MSQQRICKHCTNLGLPSDHPLRNGHQVVCPVLKNTKCQRCGKLGHTVSRCVKTPPKPTTTTLKLLKPQLPTPKPNIYKYLDSDSEPGSPSSLRRPRSPLAPPPPPLYYNALCKPTPAPPSSPVSPYPAYLTLEHMSPALPVNLSACFHSWASDTSSDC
jgi:hypothetical protein